jgi:hypothetical protein
LRRIFARPPPGRSFVARRELRRGSTLAATVGLRQDH